VDKALLGMDKEGFNFFQFYFTSVIFFKKNPIIFYFGEFLIFSNSILLR
jgi:hypothetical protein